MLDLLTRPRLLRISAILKLTLRILGVVDVFLVDYLGNDPSLSDSKG